MSRDKNTTNSSMTRQLIFRFLVDYKRRYDGNSPSSREVAEACSVSISTANYHLTQLQVENRVRVRDRRPRQIEIVGGDWEFSDGDQADQTSRDETSQEEQREEESRRGK